MPAAESLRRFEGAVAVSEGHSGLGGPLDRLVGVVVTWHVGEPLALSDRGRARHGDDGSHNAGAYRDSPLLHSAAAAIHASPFCLFETVRAGRFRPQVNRERWDWLSRTVSGWQASRPAQTITAPMLGLGAGLWLTGATKERRWSN